MPAVRVMANGAELLRTLGDPHFDPWAEALSTTRIPLPAPTADLRAADGFSAAITCYTAEAVDVRAALDRPGLLVLGDVDYPGWEVWVDGVKRDLWRVNYIMRGVVLDSGRHGVEFRYVCRPFRVGLALSLAAWGLTGLLLAADAWRRQRQRR